MDHTTSAARRPASMIRDSIVTGGTYNQIIMYNGNNQYHTYGSTINDGLHLLKDSASPAAFHNSGERYDPPKCHPNTRVAVLQKIMDWVLGSDPDERDAWIMWMSGGAGAGKSAIGQTFAERCEAEGYLLASFFFGRSDPKRNNVKSLIATIAYQIYASVPGTRDQIISTIETDPLIFGRTLLVQLLSLVIEPIKRLGHEIPQRLIIIDGLDECLDRRSQTAILETLFQAVQKHECRIRFLVISRPEHDIAAKFSFRRADISVVRLVLDDEYHPDGDIELFLKEEIQGIKEAHPFKNHIPISWPGGHVVKEMVKKSSGQFVYASTAIKYIKSNRHRPDYRLEAIRNIRPHQSNTDMPFAELDALYTHILKSVEDTSMVIQVLSFCIYETRTLSSIWGLRTSAEAIEQINNLEPGGLSILLCDIGALVVTETYKLKGKEEETIRILHASLPDFLLDKSRSKDLHIDENSEIKKHIVNCFRFLSKNIGNDSGVSVAMAFLDDNCECISSCTADMAHELDGFSILKLYEYDKVPRHLIRSFLTVISPGLVDFFSRSDCGYSSEYQTLLDETFLALLNQYPQDVLSMHISLMMHRDEFPFNALTVAFQLFDFHADDDLLAILEFPFYDDVVAMDRHFEQHIDNPRGLKSHLNTLCEFLRDPQRSKHHNFQQSTPRIYSSALLVCFNYLKRLVIHADCFIEETWLRELTCSRFHTSGAPNRTKNGTHLDYTIGTDAAESNTNYCTQGDDMVGDLEYFGESDVEEVKDDGQSFEQDMTLWRSGWDNKYLPVVSSIEASWWKANQPQAYREAVPMRYYLMLGYMIFFLPRAGRSEELIEFCKTTFLRKNPRLFPEQSRCAQRAMKEYVQRTGTEK